MVRDTNLTSIIVSIPIIITFMSVLVIFSSYFIYVTGNNYIAVPLVYQVTPLMGFDNLSTDGIQQAGDQYYSINLAIIDYFFLFGVISILVECLLLSYIARQYNYFSFLGILVYGMMVILFIVSVVLNFSDWLYEMMINMFPTLVIQLPIFNYVITNIGKITFYTGVIMLLINQLDFNFSQIINRKQKEQQALGEDEVL